MFRTVIFDWSGTISDDRKPVYEANCRLCRSLGITPRQYNDWLRSTTMSVGEYFAALNTGLTNDEVHKRFGQLYDEVSENGLPPRIYKDAKAILTSLKLADKELFVLSSHPTQNLAKEAKQYGVLSLITKLYGDSKDKAQDLGSLLAAYDYNPHEAVYVGDMVFDIRAAKEVNVTAVAMTTGYHPREMLVAEQPDYILDSLAQLKDLL